MKKTLLAFTGLIFVATMAFAQDDNAPSPVAPMPEAAPAPTEVAAPVTKESKKETKAAKKSKPKQLQKKRGKKGN